MSCQYDVLWAQKSTSGRTVSANGDGELEAGVSGLAGNLGQLVTLVHACKGRQIVRAAGRDCRRAARNVDLRAIKT